MKAIAENTDIFNPLSISTPHKASEKNLPKKDRIRDSNLSLGKDRERCERDTFMRHLDLETLSNNKKCLDNKSVDIETRL